MLYNFVILLALASTVVTSVVVNVYEADGEVGASHSLRDSCNSRDCDQLCRRLGFKGGMCRGNECTCSNFGALKEVKAVEHSLHDSCNYQACDQMCRRLGFPGGACVGDKCKCDNFMPLAEYKADYSVRGGCNYQACDQMCRRLGFPGGACVGDTCKCDNFEPIKIKGKLLEYLLKSTKETKTFEDCNLEACDLLCRNLGFPGGTCVGDRCDCNDSKVENESEYQIGGEDAGENDREEENTDFVSLNEAATLPGSCDIFACNDMCHRLNYIGGFCMNGSCRCY